MVAGNESEICEASAGDSDLVRAELLDQRILHLKTLYEVSRDIFSSVEPNAILRNFLLMTLGNFGVVEGFVLSLTLPAKELRHAVFLGLSDGEMTTLKHAARCVPPRKGYAEVGDLWDSFHETLPAFICCTVPFWVTPHHPAILGLGPKLNNDRYTDDDRELLTTLANSLAVALKNAESFEEINCLNRNLQTKNVELEQALDELRTVLDKLTRAYHELKAAQVQIVEKEKMERELMVAREIQRSILPCTLPHFTGYDLGAQILPARAVGGDFFDLIPLGTKALGIAVGDVSDKGVPAAIFMAVTRSLIRSEAGRARFPREAMLNVNRLLLEMNNACMFVTVLYGVLDGETGEFSYVRAGHDPPILFSRNGKAFRPPFDPGQPLGVFPNPLLDERTVILSPGDLLLLYTDGVTDARNEQKTFFGRDRLCSTVCGCGKHSAQSVCDHLLQTVMCFQDAAAQEDDVTLVAVRRL